MKKSRLYVFAAMALLLIAVACRSNRGTVERPFIESANTTSLSFDRVELSDSSTVLYGVIHYEPGYWVRLASSSEISVDSTSYPMVSIEGIAADEQVVIPDSGVVRFTMTFPAIPKDVKSIDFAETTDGGWQIWGIDLTGKADHNINQKAVPSAAKRQREMPDPDFAYGDTTVINVHILGYRPEMGNKLTWCANTLHGQIGFDNPVKVDKEGNAVVKLDLSAPAYFMPVNIGDRVQVGGGFYVAPGENLNGYIDTHISGIWNMETRDEIEGGMPEDFCLAFSDGVYPQFNRGVETMPIYSGEFGNYRMNGDEYTAYILDMYKSLGDSIAANPELTEIDRRVNKARLMAELINVASIPMVILSRNYYATNRDARWGSPIPADSMNCVLSPENLKEIAAVVDFNDKDMLLFNDFDRVNAGVWEEAGIDAGIVKMVNDYMNAYAKAENGELKTPVDASLKKLDKALVADLEAHNAAIKAQLEAMGADRVTPTPDVAPEKVFDAIIAPHKGKVVMVDLWNTWCGPCRAAIAENEPEKSGDLSSDDIVWIYIANQTSPEGTYLRMINDIKGIHYQVDAETWKAICKRFDVDGIPFYILVDRNGKAEGRPDIRDHTLYKKTLLNALSR